MCVHAFVRHPQTVAVANFAATQEGMLGFMLSYVCLIMLLFGRSSVCMCHNHCTLTVGPECRNLDFVVFFVILKYHQRINGFVPILVFVYIVVVGQVLVTIARADCFSSSN